MIECLLNVSPINKWVQIFCVLATCASLPFWWIVHSPLFVIFHNFSLFSGSGWSCRKPHKKNVGGIPKTSGTNKKPHHPLSVPVVRACCSRMHKVYGQATVTYRFPSNHRSQAPSSGVSTWMGDHPRTPRAVGNTWCTRHMAKPRPQVGRVC